MPHSPQWIRFPSRIGMGRIPIWNNSNSIHSPQYPDDSLESLQEYDPGISLIFCKPSLSRSLPTICLASSAPGFFLPNTQNKMFRFGARIAMNVSGHEISPSLWAVNRENRFHSHTPIQLRLCDRTLRHLAAMCLRRNSCASLGTPASEPNRLAPSKHGIDCHKRRSGIHCDRFVVGDFVSRRVLER